MSSPMTRVQFDGHEYILKSVHDDIMKSRQEVADQDMKVIYDLEKRWMIEVEKNGLLVELLNTIRLILKPEGE